MLIQDCTILDNIQILSENSGSNGTMKIRGVFQRADELNANKRLYKKSLLEGSISKIKPLIEGRMLLGELDHPEASVVRLSTASHLITSLKMKGNEMIGEAEILNTPAGKIVQTLIKDGVKIGISSRGTGTVTENRDGSKEVNEDFKLITFDVVADPSTRGAYPQLAESKKLDMQDTLKRTFGEKVFVTLLKEELDEGSLGMKRSRKIAASTTANPEQRISLKEKLLHLVNGVKEGAGDILRDKKAFGTADKETRNYWKERKKQQITSKKKVVQPKKDVVKPKLDATFESVKDVRTVLKENLKKLCKK